MRPAARLQAVIEILDGVEEGIRTLASPADRVVADYCRKRRFIGSKDRRAISGLVYSVIRRRGFHVWRANSVKLPVDGRNLLISHLADSAPDDLQLFGDAAPHSPVGLTASEQEAVTGFTTLKAGAQMPLSARIEVPDFLEPALRQRFGAEFETAMAALNQAAPLDIRSNPLQPHHTLTKDLIKISEGIEKTNYSPIGYRSESKARVTGTDLYMSGKIEVQDEAAQLACYLVDAQPGMAVIDLCAGAGGKSLLLSGLMNNKGQVFAFDVSSKRLSALAVRSQRAGSRNIQVKAVPEVGANRERILSGLNNKADRVVIDAPCSGTGTWRRNPDQRWRLSEPQITDYAAVQLGLLTEGAQMVAPGGRLVYMTCSLLHAENEAVVDAFFAEQGTANWKLVNYKSVWNNVLPSEPVGSAAKNQAMLQLVPHLHHTDGFFVAILEKS